MIERHALLQSLQTLLLPERFKDYCHNGLQVEGRTDIRHLVSGVTASEALIQAAIDCGADAILVHHGLFWKGFDGQVSGWMRKRLSLLLSHDINLFAYHLPLDAHPELGNNAQLGRLLGLQAHASFGEQSLGLLGTTLSGGWESDAALAQHVEAALGRSVTLVSGRVGPVSQVGWCTGGAQGYFEPAIAAGAQVFITGEISEPQAHYARECGVSYIACGHHASERYGAPAVASKMATDFGIRHTFIDIPNPA
ncbi:Nif3-like dinuclear metal center hexameric protein [Rhodoferax mekongensis]|uniref:Nif3-like dinuclear metal center hexameric protein n=1 Tax=Rhodoferax mekongensis TaxID=3068341 RepID=A0ABZ0B2Y9_9BURK|nr:Nif3-like dinuclear metal center hexameric protein [Rhodoferax sp. TBRC 17307]WNO06218.1 Nif3-like dinuclear metal center hexameric protein [Rhodoferax sp. TBRC 17307]